MTDSRPGLMAQLQRNSDDTCAFFQSLNDSQLAVTVYDDEVHWTVRQVLAHFVTIEASMQRLFADMLAGGPGSSRDFDILRFNRSQPPKLDGVPMPDLIDRFAAVRNHTIDMVSSMSPADLDRTGYHPFHGDGRLERFIRWAYEHVDLHLEDVRRILKLD